MYLISHNCTLITRVIDTMHSKWRLYPLSFNFRTFCFTLNLTAKLNLTKIVHCHWSRPRNRCFICHLKDIWIFEQVIIEYLFKLFRLCVVKIMPGLDRLTKDGQWVFYLCDRWNSKSNVFSCDLDLWGMDTGHGHCTSSQWWQQLYQVIW